MLIERWMIFVTVCFVASMTPGPGILSVITHSVTYGTKHSIPIILGILSALFFPFINPDGNTYSQFIILLLTLLGCSAFSLFFYSIGAQAVSPTIKKYSNAFNKITGGCFIGLSLMLATSSSKT